MLNSDIFRRRKNEQLNVEMTLEMNNFNFLSRSLFIFLIKKLNLRRLNYTFPIKTTQDIHMYIFCNTLDHWMNWYNLIKLNFQYLDK